MTSPTSIETNAVEHPVSDHPWLSPSALETRGFSQSVIQSDNGCSGRFYCNITATNTAAAATATTTTTT